MKMMVMMLMMMIMIKVDRRPTPYALRHHALYIVFHKNDPF